MGTVELTGLLMTAKKALGACTAAASAMEATMDAFVLKRSSRVMPGLRGTPAGMMTSFASLSASPISSLP